MNRPGGSDPEQEGKDPMIESTGELASPASPAGTSDEDAVARFAGGVAHDLNNVLGAVRGYADLLRYRIEDPDLAGYLCQIDDAVERGAVLIQDLLAYAGRSAFRPTVFAAHPLIRQAVSMARDAEGEHPDVTAAYHTRGDRIEADLTLLRQALDALLANACEIAGPEGSVRVITESVEGPHPDGGEPATWFRIGVYDSGAPVPPESRATLFEPFPRPGQINDPRAGPALAAAAGIARRHGGWIEVADRSDGAEFRLHLPVQ